MVEMSYCDDKKALVLSENTEIYRWNNKANVYLRRDTEKCSNTGELKRGKQEDEPSLAVRLIFPEERFRNGTEGGQRTAAG